jgi:hypothetical protein
VSVKYFFYGMLEALSLVAMGAVLTYVFVELPREAWADGPAAVAADRLSAEITGAVMRLRGQVTEDETTIATLSASLAAACRAVPRDTKDKDQLNACKPVWPAVDLTAVPPAKGNASER